MVSVLLADDSATIRMALRSLLANEKELQICGEAVDGLDAVKKTRALKPDIVLLDVGMPKLNGVEAASAIKKHLPHVRIILFTMFDGAVETVGPAVADMMLSKSDGANLLKNVRELLASNPAA
jgi:DNA-binding NarL/FixJ family response regulator